jgi:flagellar hook assembly protein FlgD
MNPTSVPTEYQLSQNYPNPFNPTTSINYAMPKGGQVTIMVYDLLGSVVKTLVNQYQVEGSYKVTWDASNDNGQQVNTGNYIVKMVAGNYEKL